MVTAVNEETSDEKSGEEDGEKGSDPDEGSDGDKRGEEKKEIRFSPPRGRRQAKSGSDHHELFAECNIFIILVFSFLTLHFMSFIDVIKSTSDDCMVDNALLKKLGNKRAETLFSEHELV